MSAPHPADRYAKEKELATRMAIAFRVRSADGFQLLELLLRDDQMARDAFILAYEQVQRRASRSEP